MTTTETQPVLDHDAREAVQRGLRILARRGRTESDLRERLLSHFDEAAVDAAITRLRELRYVNDEAWAQVFVARRRSAGRSASLLRRELRLQGVPDDAIAAALEAHDEDAALDVAASEAAASLARSSNANDPARVRRRLISRLQRRGFPSHACLEAAQRQLGAMQGT